MMETLCYQIYWYICCYLISRPYWRSRYWYTVASVVVVCDVMYCG